LRVFTPIINDILPGENTVVRTLVIKAKEVVSYLRFFLSSKKFYKGTAILVFGVETNFLSQIYLNEYIHHGESLPVLSDLILNNLPYWDVGFLYDYFSVLALAVFIFYIIHKREYYRVPYIMAICGIFMFIRGIFVVLTPVGHPSMFDGTEGIFEGFSKFELGVYPSGHTAIAFMYVLFANNKTYKTILSLCVSIIIISLFLARGHYSIDVLSGLIFAYAIKSFSDKYLARYLLLPANQ
jgi:membrane-associated phospholipid phosphatase